MRATAALALAVVLALAACDGPSETDGPADAQRAAGGYAGSAWSLGQDASAPAPAEAEAAPPSPAPVASAEPAASAASSASSLSSAPAMVIRTGSASVEVDSLEPAMAAVRSLVARAGGHVGNTALQAGNSSVRSATLELRFPAGRFDEVVGGLSPVGELEYVNVSAEDVGEQYVDLEARAENARRLESRLVELLAARTGKLSDVLAVERELSRVREEIERIEGRMRWLRTRAAMSSLTVTLHEPGPMVGRPGEQPIADAFRQAWRNAVTFLAWLIAASGILVPVAVLAGVALSLWRRAARRLGTKPSGDRTEPAPAAT